MALQLSPVIAGGGGSTSIGGVISGGTEGSVLFIGSGGVLAQDNTNFFWNDTNNQLRSGAGVIFNTGLAVVGANYFVGRDADATNQLHFNVPTGAGMEWSINDTAQIQMSSAGNIGIGAAPTALAKMYLTKNISDSGTWGINSQMYAVPASPTASSYTSIAGFMSTENATENITGTVSGFAGQADIFGIVDVTTAYGASGVVGIDTTNTVTTAAGIAGHIIMLAGTATTAAALLAKPITYSAGTITTAYGAKIDPPGAGSTQWTAAIGTGNSYIAGSLRIGSTAAPTVALDVVGAIETTGGIFPNASDGAAIGSTSLMWSDLFLASGGVINFNAGDVAITHSANTLTTTGGNYVFTQAVATSGSPTGFTFTSGAHTTLANATYSGALFNLDSNIQFAGGGASFSAESMELHVNPTISAAAAQTIDSWIGVHINGPVLAGTNVTIGAVTTVLIGGSPGSATNLNANLVVECVPLNNGVGAVGTSSGFITLEATLSLGNQTATLTNFNNVRLEAQTLESTTNTRTVTNPATIYAEAPVASTNVTFTNQALAADFVGSTRTSGKIIQDGTTTSSGAGAVGITGSIHEITTTGTGDALSLANGTEGQRIVIVYVAEGAGTDTAVITPTSMAGGTTVTFSVIGQRADGVFTAGKWFFIAQGAVIA